jgi:hypothetical protein
MGYQLKATEKQIVENINSGRYLLPGSKMTWKGLFRKEMIAAVSCLRNVFQPAVPLICSLLRLRSGSHQGISVMPSFNDISEDLFQVPQRDVASDHRFFRWKICSKVMAMTAVVDSVILRWSRDDHGTCFWFPRPAGTRGRAETWYDFSDGKNAVNDLLKWMEQFLVQL